MLANFLFRGSCRDPGNEHRVPRPRRSIGRGVIDRRRQIEIDDASATLTAVHRYSPRLFTSWRPSGEKLLTVAPLGSGLMTGFSIAGLAGVIFVGAGCDTTLDVPARSSSARPDGRVGTGCVFGAAPSISGVCAR